MKTRNNRLSVFLELMEVMERAFIFKIKKREPEISDGALRERVKAWYLARPGAENGDGVGTPGDIGRLRQ